MTTRREGKSKNANYSSATAAKLLVHEVTQSSVVSRFNYRVISRIHNVCTYNHTHTHTQYSTIKHRCVCV